MGGFLGATELATRNVGGVKTVDLADVAVATAKVADDAVTSPKLDGPIIRYAEVEIPAADVLTLFSVGKELVAAPGAGLVLEFVSIELAYDYDGVAGYTIGTATNLQVRYTGLVGLVVSTVQAATGFLDGVADDLRMLDKVEQSATPIVNSPLVLTLLVADVTIGASPVHAKVAYRVHATGL